MQGDFSLVFDKQMKKKRIFADGNRNEIFEAHENQL